MNQRIANLHARLARLERQAEFLHNDSYSDRANQLIKKELETTMGKIEGNLAYYTNQAGRTRFPSHAAAVRDLKKALARLRSTSAEVTRLLGEAEYEIISDN
tara:strand:+ start:347 stop:652 length:306 start_codon:yes stop_codon:yes gene_type:complete